MGRPELGSSASVSRDLYSLHALAYDLQLTESVDALVALLELAGLDLDADSLQLVVKVRDGVLCAGVVPDDEAAQRLAGLAAPCDGALTLVRDTWKRRRMWEREDKSKRQICRLQELRGHLMMAVTHR